MLLFLLNFFYILFFNYSLHATLFCISFRYTAWWLVNPILYKVFPSTFQVPQYGWLYFLCFTSLWLLRYQQPTLPDPFSLFSPRPQLSSPLAPISLFSVSVNLFLFCLFILFLDSTCKWNHMVSVWLISLSTVPSRSTHAVANGKILLFSMTEYYCTYILQLLYPLVCWTDTILIALPDVVDENLVHLEDANSYSIFMLLLRQR